MTFLEDRPGSTMSEAEILPWPGRGMSSTGDLLSDRDVTTAPARPRLAPRPAAPLGLSVGQVLAAHGALEDNWDGRGAVAPSLASIRIAQRFVADLPTSAVPSISASVEGGVLLEWESQVVDLMLDIANSGLVEALVCWPTGEELEGPLTTVKQPVLDALALLLNQG